MAGTAAMRSGTFSPITDRKDLPPDLRKMVEHLEESGSDWTQCRGYIAVRCHDAPYHYSIVVAKVVFEGETVEVEV